MSSGTDIAAPAANEIEVSLFSRGYGESACIHVGQGRWIIIDSLRDEDGTPTALRYLAQLSVPPSEVVAVLLTHWHDDHVSGAADVVEACPRAVIALTGVLQRDEFKAFLRSVESSEGDGFTSGVDELFRVLGVLRARGQAPRFCWGERRITASQASPSFEFEALSPSDVDYQHMLAALTEWAASADGARRLAAPRRNDASVAAVIQVEDELLLFGADLEVTRPAMGWHEVHGVAWRQRGAASFFKIAHHGSPTGDYPPVWDDLLVANVQAALTPWSRGAKLPSAADVQRILDKTPNAHAASKVRSRSPIRRLNTVDKSLREAGIAVYRSPAEAGHLRLRKAPGAAWNVAYVAGDSCHLSQVLTS